MIEFNKRHGEKIAEAAGFLFNPTHDVVVARTDDRGKLLGGVVFYDYTGKSISMHVAGFTPRWINPEMLWVTFDYPFVQLKCESIFCQVKSSNKHTLKFIEKIGFEEEVVIKDVFSDADLVVSRMYANTCRWLGLKPRFTCGGKVGTEDAGRVGSVH